MLDELIEAYGVDAKAKLAGPGDAEANIRKPLENLLVGAAAALDAGKVTFYDEVSDFELGVRPDYAFSIGGAIAGYVEVKKPKTNLDPDSFTGHNKKQWLRQRDLPNLLYTNGTEFRLYRDGEPVSDPVSFTGGPLDSAGKKLAAGESFRVLLLNLFAWEPVPIRSVTKLVKAIAPLTRLLREAVLEQLDIESIPGTTQTPFTGLAGDWRGTLFPEASDEVFADGYAQTVTFALLLAKSEEIELDPENLHQVGEDLGHRHSLMGRALQILTQNLAAPFKVTLRLLTRVVASVDWPKIESGSRDAYLHLYEKFLEEYDPDLRKLSGSYYTPIEVVDEMVRLTEEALVGVLGIKESFRDDRVLVVDPAMGTGTYLQSIMERGADQIENELGAGAVPNELVSIAERSVGFEIQTGPYAVAELRLARLLSQRDAEPPENGLRLYVADTLDDPNAPIESLGSNLQAISDSRRAAAKVKREENVTVVIGNPPYRERAEGEGGWIEKGGLGSAKKGKETPLDQFRAEGNGLTEYVLKNLYVYFWRWGTWKVFDSLKESSSGVVCFISTAGYLRGVGFSGMREYLRRRCSHGWVIDVSPEGMRPEVNTRIFPGVQQPLAIGIFVRRSDGSADTPAKIQHRTVTGLRQAKYEQLSQVSLEDDGWRDVRSAWQAPFSPAAESDWDSFPALNDLLPWTAPGVKPNRRWVYSPSPDCLSQRWRIIVSEKDQGVRAKLFVEGRDANLKKEKQPLPGVSFKPDHAFTTEAGDCPDPIQVGFRAFDRQWLIPDARLLSQARPDLWAARRDDQVFCIEQHSKVIRSGPGVVFTSLIPDMDHFKGSEGGRTLPLLHPNGSTNTAAGLLESLSNALGQEILGTDLLAYVAGVVSHPGFVETFSDELTTPGVRVPITRNPDLFDEAVVLGRRVLWLHSFGLGSSFEPEGEKLLFSNSDPQRPRILTAMKGMPDEPEQYDAKTQTLSFGTAQFGPVSPEVIAFEVGGRNVIHSWCGYRKKDPAGRRSSPLDDVNPNAWTNDWTRELLELITVLQKLVDQEGDQLALLEAILAGPKCSRDELAEAGVSWPASKADRKPRYDTIGQGSLALE